jgi:hypothetical protein
LREFSLVDNENIEDGTGSPIIWNTYSILGDGTKSELVDKKGTNSSGYGTL